MHLRTLSLPDTANQILTNPPENKKVVLLKGQMDGYIIILILSHRESTKTCYVKSNENQPGKTRLLRGKLGKRPGSGPTRRGTRESRAVLTTPNVCRESPPGLTLTRS